MAKVCQDATILEKLREWSDKVELWVMMTFCPRPGGEGWDTLLECIQGGSDAVRFPSELGEQLRPWIPAPAYARVVARN